MLLTPVEALLALNLLYVTHVKLLLVYPALVVPFDRVRDPKHPLDGQGTVILKKRFAFRARRFVTPLDPAV